MTKSIYFFSILDLIITFFDHHGRLVLNCTFCCTISSTPTQQLQQQQQQDTGCFILFTCTSYMFSVYRLYNKTKNDDYIVQDHMGACTCDFQVSILINVVDDVVRQITSQTNTRTDNPWMCMECMSSSIFRELFRQDTIPIARLNGSSHSLSHTHTHNVFDTFT